DRPDSQFGKSACSGNRRSPPKTRTVGQTSRRAGPAAARGQSELSAALAGRDAAPRGRGTAAAAGANAAQPAAATRQSTGESAGRAAGRPAAGRAAERPAGWAIAKRSLRRKRPTRREWDAERSGLRR